jgi:hypothetical protein
MSKPVLASFIARNAQPASPERGEFFDAADTVLSMTADEIRQVHALMQTTGERELDMIARKVGLPAGHRMVIHPEDWIAFLDEIGIEDLSLALQV